MPLRCPRKRCRFLLLLYLHNFGTQYFHEYNVIVLSRNKKISNDKIPSKILNRDKNVLYSSECIRIINFLISYPFKNNVMFIKTYICLVNICLMLNAPRYVQ